MVPNHHTPIEQSGLWNILDWDLVVRLSLDAPNDPREGGGRAVLAWYAKQLVEAASKPGKEDERMFHRIASPWIGNGDDAIRRRRAGALALAFGARPDRLIAFVAYKWGLFKR